MLAADFRLAGALGEENSVAVPRGVMPHRVGRYAPDVQVTPLCHCEGMSLPKATECCSPYGPSLLVCGPDLSGFCLLGHAMAMCLFVPICSRMFMCYV